MYKIPSMLKPKKGRKKLSIMTSIVTETSGLYPSVQAGVVHRYISDVEQYQKLSGNEGNIIVTCTWGTNSRMKPTNISDSWSIVLQGLREAVTNTVVQQLSYTILVSRKNNHSIFPYTNLEQQRHSKPNLVIIYMLSTKNYC